MSSLSKLIAASGLALVLSIPAFSAPQVVVAPVATGPRVIVRPFIGIGPGWYGWYGPGWYGYYAYGPYYYPGYGYAYYDAGNVRIDTKIKNGAIYVDGGYAGATGKLKKFALTPGNHDIEVRDANGKAVFKEKVQVMAGRTVDIRPGA